MIKEGQLEFIGRLGGKRISLSKVLESRCHVPSDKVANSERKFEDPLTEVLEHSPSSRSFIYEVSYLG